MSHNTFDNGIPTRDEKAPVPSRNLVPMEFDRMAMKINDLRDAIDRLAVVIDPALTPEDPTPVDPQMDKSDYPKSAVVRGLEYNNNELDGFITILNRLADRVEL